jgi:hypothetical protein
MKRGQQKEIPAFTGKREYLHVIGAYNWRSAPVSHVNVERKNSDTFITFLEQLISQYPTQSLILVMDNPSYHHSAKVQALLSLLEQRVRLFWLLQYCPELNIIGVTQLKEGDTWDEPSKSQPLCEQGRVCY